ncbi:MAG: ABC transporter ATP-binding protein [Hyphomicrobiaceae bacterium]
MMLQVRGLQVVYGGMTAVEDVSFDVGRGEIVTLIGANGAGKSSTLMAISGLVPVRAGQILFEGSDMTNATAHETVARGLVQVPEGRMIFASLTVGENLAVAGHGHKPAELRGRLDEVIAQFPVLKDRLDEPAANLSGGQLQLLALARGLMADPKLLLLDEPTLGLAPLAMREVLTIIEDLKRTGLTVLLIEQNVRQALKIADRAYVLEAGRLVLSGTPQELLDDPRLISAYLGQGMVDQTRTQSSGGSDA